LTQDTHGGKRNEVAIFREKADENVPYVNVTTQLDVETDYLDEQTMCGSLPFAVTKIVVPGVPAVSSAFSTAQLDGFTCKGLVAKFDF
jgi:hypothetical protein